MWRLTFRRWAVVVLVLGGLTARAPGGMWQDDFGDGVVDLSNYQVNLADGGGVCTVAETADPNTPEPLGYAELFTNSPGGSYVLTAVQVEPGDTVRTVFQQVDAWNAYSISTIGLTYDLTAGRYMDYSVAAFFMQQRRDNVMAYRHIDTVEELVGLDNAGNPEGQTWVYEMVVGPESGGAFDVTLTVYDLDGTQRGDSVTLTTSTPTGEMYWFAGDSRSLDYIYHLEIGPNLGPIGPKSCQEVIAGGLQDPYDLNGDCYVNLLDLAVLGANWLSCIDPENQLCTHPWLTP